MRATATITRHNCFNVVKWKFFGNRLQCAVEMWCSHQSATTRCIAVGISVFDRLDVDGSENISAFFPILLFIVFRIDCLRNHLTHERATYPCALLAAAVPSPPAKHTTKFHFYLRSATCIVHLQLSRSFINVGEGERESATTIVKQMQRKYKREENIAVEDDDKYLLSSN